jgi:bifunctional enzyme Fae/Hps
LSEYSGKKPEFREEFIKLLRSAKKSEMRNRMSKGFEGKNPTVSGTARMMKIHRDTLYEWMREFDVKFKDVKIELEPEKPLTSFPVYLIGEALTGEGSELAHIDLIVGDKQGPVGRAFANGLSNFSAGHTPLLAVIRPNLPSKPYTLLVPKVTVKNLEQANKVFGPLQAAVAKAIADAVEEKLIPEDKIEEWVIICSTFLHPEAKDFRKIYHYNYGATKLALKRALTGYPPLSKIIYDKDRAKHPVMGFKVPRLWRPPYIQIAFDIPSTKRMKRIVKELPDSDRIILEVGTPLLKKYGVRAIRELRDLTKDKFIVADLKTLDVGKVEVDLAYEETADAVVASGLASKQTLNKFIYEAQRFGIYAFLDMMYVENPVQKLLSLQELPEGIILHRAIDVEKTVETRWELIREIRKTFKAKKLLIGVAGGITPEKAPEALANGADILIVGRYITQSRDPKRAVREFLECTREMVKDIDLLRVHVE